MLLLLLIVYIVWNGVNLSKRFKVINNVIIYFIVWMHNESSNIIYPIDTTQISSINDLCLIYRSVNQIQHYQKCCDLQYLYWLKIIINITSTKIFIVSFLLYILYCILPHNNIIVVSFSVLAKVKMRDCLINKCLMQLNAW